MIAQFRHTVCVTEILNSLHPEATLYVAATHEEASAMPHDVPLIITGVGTTRAAVELTMLLTRAQAADALPQRIVNFGTVGALHDVTGIFEVSDVFRHDFSSDILEEMNGTPFPNKIDLETVTDLPKAHLATGDSFINDSATRDRLAQKAELVDMEGHAIAFVAQRFGVPVTLIKQVSDGANEDSAAAWEEAAKSGAEALAQAALGV